MPGSDLLPWLSPHREDWLGEVHEWASAELTQLGHHSLPRLQVFHERPWSIVLTLESSGAKFFVKVNASSGMHEATLAMKLASQWPDLVPAPLAIRTDRGWMLTSTVGVKLKESHEGEGLLRVWKGILPRYAALQASTATHCEALLASGVPDQRTSHLPTLLRELLSRDQAIGIGASDGVAESDRERMLLLLPCLEEQCAMLAFGPVPDALEHGDLHNGNVLIVGETPWLIDWADSSVCHPFHSVLVTLSILQGSDLDLQAPLAVDLRDAYLRAWESNAAPSLLQKLFRTAMWTGHVVRALNWDRMLADAPPESRKRYGSNVARWLKLWLERRDLVLTHDT